MALRDSALKQNVMDTLQGGPIAWVNFTASGRVIGTMHYAMLAGAWISPGRVKLVVDPSTIRPGAAAEYHGDVKTIFTRTPEIRYIDEKVTLVHECTHAGCDVIYGARIIDLVDETLAYLAGAIFWVATNAANKGNANTLPTGNGPAGSALNIVTNKNISFIGTTNAAGPIAFTNTEIAPLQKAIKENPLYRDKWRQSN